MADTELLKKVVTEHSPGYGVMSSPSHWAYRGNWTHDETGKPWRERDPNETSGHWFAFCDGRPGDPRTGCGWDSEPTTYETKEEAWDAALTHLATCIANAHGEDNG